METKEICSSDHGSWIQLLACIAFYENLDLKPFDPIIISAVRQFGLLKSAKMKKSHGEQALKNVYHHYEHSWFASKYLFATMKKVRSLSNSRRFSQCKLYIMLVSGWQMLYSNHLVLGCWIFGCYNNVDIVYREILKLQ